MFVQMVHIKIKPDRVAEFVEAFRINFEGTVKEPDNIRFDVLQDPEDDTKFLIYEVFASEGAVDEHRKTEHYKKTTALLEDMMEGPRSKDFFRMVMPSGLDGGA